jgi:hypothetical protein
VCPFRIIAFFSIAYKDITLADFTQVC